MEETVAGAGLLTAKREKREHGMKKMLALLLALTLCLTLWACGAPQEDNNTQDNAALNTDNGEMNFSENNSADEEEKADAVEPTHSWKDADCSNPKTCANCGKTEGEALGHSWSDATCAAPKTCSVCGATEGEKAAHTYTNGVCSACNDTHPVKEFETGYWQAYILFAADDEYGEELNRFMLAPGDDGTFSCREFFEKNPHGEQAFDEEAYNGKTYYNYSFSAAMGGFEYEALANGNVKVNFVWGNGTVIELKEEAAGKLVVATTTNENYIPTGTVFTSGE